MGLPLAAGNTKSCSPFGHAKRQRLSSETSSSGNSTVRRLAFVFGSQNAPRRHVRRISAVRRFQSMSPH